MVDQCISPGLVRSVEGPNLPPAPITAMISVVCREGDDVEEVAATGVAIGREEGLVASGEMVFIAADVKAGVADTVCDVILSCKAAVELEDTREVLGLDPSSCS